MPVRVGSLSSTAGHEPAPNDLLHLDVHFGKVRSGGRQIYLTDLGTVTSSWFEPNDADLVALHLVNYIRKSVPRPSPAVVEMLERLGPTADRWNGFYGRLMGRSGQ